MCICTYIYVYCPYTTDSTGMFKRSRRNYYVWVKGDHIRTRTLESGSSPKEAACNFMRRKFPHITAFRLKKARYTPMFISLFKLLVSNDGVHWREDGYIKAHPTS